MIDMFAAFAVTLLFGGIVFVAAVMAPLVFTQLPAEQADCFIRAVFPLISIYVFAIAAVGAMALYRQEKGCRMVALELRQRQSNSFLPYGVTIQARLCCMDCRRSGLSRMMRGVSPSNFGVGPWRSKPAPIGAIRSRSSVTGLRTRQSTTRPCGSAAA